MGFRDESRTTILESVSKITKFLVLEFYKRAVSLQDLEEEKNFHTSITVQHAVISNCNKYGSDF